jgi:hypothetical protein
MNCIKFRSELPSKKTHFQIYILAITISLFFSSCGGGTVPEYLSEAKVDVSIWTPKKEVVFKKEGLNLVKAIVPLKDSTNFLIVSGKQVYRLINNELNPDFKSINPSLYDIAILRNTIGEPSYIIGSGLSGEPSAAVLDINGQLKWKKDYGYDAMGKTAVLDDGDERFVVLKKKEDLLFLNFESGEIVRKESPNRIIASADFSGDGHREVLVGLAETDFAILDGKLNELNKISLSDDYWYEPIVTSAVHPFVVFSAGDVLDVYDSKLNFVKKFVAEGALSPMHVTAAVFLGEGPNAPFAAIYEGRGGWHMSILYVFSSTGKLVYKEILKGNFQSITSVAQGDKTGFLLGGRNEVLRYSFKR